MRQMTLCFLVKGSEVCLGLKKRGFGAGRWNGLGGKVLAGEAVEAAAIRETEEEVGVRIGKLEKMAELTFTFLGRSDWDQVVHTYFAREWSGEPSESEEMRPQWFDISRLPFEQMWPDDPYWLPRLLAGQKVKGRFSFGENALILEKEVEKVETI